MTTEQYEQTEQYERLISDDDLRALMQEEEPIETEMLPAQPQRRPSWLRTRAEVARERYASAADEARGWWGDSPASLATLRAFIAERAAGRSALLLQIYDWACGTLALASCGLIYGTLWTLRKPIMWGIKSDGPPSLAQIRTAIAESSLAGRVYGHLLVGWTHLVGYGLAWWLQLPGRMANALPWLAAAAYYLFF